MEEQIKNTAHVVKVIYGCFWLLTLVCVLLGELDAGWVGTYASNVKLVYLVETVVILLTAVLVPLSLKLFAWVMSKKISSETLPVALRMYVWWYAVRLFLLAFPVGLGFLSYYLLMSSKGVLCALIGLTASLFCLPGEERLRRELQIEKE